MNLNALKTRVREIGGIYADREERARRLFIEERVAALHFDREREFSIRTEISQFFEVPYSSISFCGSAQIGFSVHKDRLFEPGSSDLDVACISPVLFQRAWTDVINTTRGFTDLTPFGMRSPEKVDQFISMISKRGVILINAMPTSDLSKMWTIFELKIGAKHSKTFRGIGVAIYMNEYAFCWKQDSSIATLMKG
jgi:hypothetical protein